jgi:pimeloyl-ACP methyl ester carboxylesterase
MTAQITIEHVEKRGVGPDVLVLHGGGGPATVASLVEHVASRAHVLAPTHPGWNGTAAPRRRYRVGDLARAYLDLLRERECHDVTVVGSSIGGWIAAEMALADRDGLLARLILLDATGIRVDAEPILDIFGLDPRGLAEHSFHDPRRFAPPAATSAEQAALQRGNLAALQALAGEPYMHDPQLLPRLREVRVPALLLWGESDRVTTPGYGAAFAAALAAARLEIIPEAGHLPHLERPDAVFAHIDAFLGAAPSERKANAPRRSHRAADSALEARR